MPVAGQRAGNQQTAMAIERIGLRAHRRHAASDSAASVSRAIPARNSFDAAIFS